MGTKTRNGNKRNATQGKTPSNKNVKKTPGESSPAKKGPCKKAQLVDIRRSLLYKTYLQRDEPKESKDVNIKFGETFENLNEERIGQHLRVPLRSKMLEKLLLPSPKGSQSTKKNPINMQNVPPSMRMAGIIKPFRVERYRESPNYLFDAMEHQVVSSLCDRNANTYLKRVGFQSIDPVKDRIVTKFDTYVVLAGVSRVLSPKNVINTKPLSKKKNDEEILANQVKHVEFKRNTATKSPRNLLYLTTSEWVFLQEKLKEGKTVIIMITREFVDATWVGKNRTGKKTLTTRDVPYTNINGHCGSLCVSEKKCIFFDCNNFLFCPDDWPTDYYAMLKKGIIHNILKNLKLQWRMLDIFEIPVTMFSFGVADSCMLYTLFAIEQVVAGSANTDLNATLSQCLLYNEKVSAILSGRTFLYEELLSNIIISNGRIDFTYEELQQEKIKHVERMIALGNIKMEMLRIIDQ